MAACDGQVSDVDGEFRRRSGPSQAGHQRRYRVELDEQEPSRSTAGQHRRQEGNDGSAESDGGTTGHAQNHPGTASGQRRKTFIFSPKMVMYYNRIETSPR